MKDKQWTREMPQVDGCYLWRFITIKGPESYKKETVGVIRVKGGEVAELTQSPVRYTPAKYWLHMDKFGNPFIEFMALGELD